VSESEIAIRKALSIYMSEQDPLYVNLAAALAQKARAMIESGRLAEADKLLAETAEAAGKIGKNEQNARSRRSIDAFVLGLRGEWHFRRGDANEARAFFNRAVGSDPGGKNADHWRRCAEACARKSERLFPSN
jgi:tetratricopeptide (TPR) repeat protein